MDCSNLYLNYLNWLLIIMHQFNNPKTKKNAVLSAYDYFRNKCRGASTPNGRTMISKVSENWYLVTWKQAVGKFDKVWCVILTLKLIVI